MKIETKKIDGTASGETSLSKAVFGLEVREDLITRVYQWQFANAHRGSKKTLAIGEVSGSTKKPFKQKGTGNARQGTKRAPHMRGGALAHASHSLFIKKKLPKKVRTLGLKHALSAKAKSKDVIVFDDYKLSKVNTKSLKDNLEKIKLDDCLFVGNFQKSSNEENFVKSSKNLNKIKTLPQEAINVKSILSYKKLAFSKEALTYLDERLA